MVVSFDDTTEFGYNRIAARAKEGIITVSADYHCVFRAVEYSDTVRIEFSACGHIVRKIRHQTAVIPGQFYFRECKTRHIVAHRKFECDLFGRRT